jgi:hypothetical protein
VVWWVEKLAKTLTSTELATQVAIRLVKQYESYEHALGGSSLNNAEII